MAEKKKEQIKNKSSKSKTKIKPSKIKAANSAAARKKAGSYRQKFRYRLSRRRHRRFRRRARSLRTILYPHAFRCRHRFYPHSPSGPEPCQYDDGVDRKAHKDEVQEGKSGMQVEPDNIYVIPPNRNISIFHRTIALSVPIDQRGLRMPIDFFFRSLAEDQGEKAICIILSGTGADGTLGLRAVNGAGACPWSRIRLRPNITACRIAPSRQVLSILLFPQKRCRTTDFVRRSFLSADFKNGCARGQKDTRLHAENIYAAAFQNGA